MLQPLVPGVRVGDVLHGTRRLRRWLRASWIWTSLAAHRLRWMERGHMSNYSPKREEEFVVIANEGDAFVVFNENYPLLIPFLNPAHSPIEQPDRMNSSIFSTWFIRTAGKKPSLVEWDSRARYIWFLIQMRGAQMRVDGTRKFNGFLRSFSSAMDTPLTWNPANVFTPLLTINYGNWTLQTTRENVKSCLAHGLPRGKSSRDNSVYRNFPQGAGPLYSDVAFFEADAARLAQVLEPRVAQVTPRGKDIEPGSLTSFPRTEELISMLNQITGTSTGRS